MIRIAVAVAALVLGASLSHAQELPPAADSAIARAVELAAGQDSSGGRAILDSIVAAPGSTPLVRGEAAYWLSRLAPSAAERERALGAFIVDHPFSPRVAPALYELGMLELAQNERDRAITHLSRYLTAAPADSGRVTASLTLGRLLVERGEMPRGCAALLIGRSEVPETAIELRNQFEFSIARCQGVDTSTKLEAPPAADTIPAPRRTGAFTVQVAAYDTKRPADRLAATLRSQGLEARVVGTSRPFRVRVGRYASRDLAEEASRRVDAVAKSKSIVVVVGPEER